MSRIAELSAALQEKAAFIKEGAEKGIRIDGSNVEVKSEDYAALVKAMDEAKQIKSLIMAETFGDDTAKFLADLSSPTTQSAAMAAAAAGSFGPQVKTLGEMFVASDQFKSFQKTGRSTMDEPWRLDTKDVTSLGTFQQKDVFTGSLSGAVNPQGFGRVQRDPFVPRPQRPNRVRDLFPVASTSANLIDYFRVLGFVESDGDGNAGTVAERDGSSFALKPKSNLQFEPAQAPVRTIAHWEAAHRNVLQDEPQLQSVINNELLYGLALEEDDQILNGDGTGENLLGILNTPNIQTYTQASGDSKADAIRRSITLAVIANYAPSGVVLHPLDWEDIELTKATGGDEQYVIVSNVAIGAASQLWRQPVVETAAMNEGTWLTGAFGIGAQLYDRESAAIRIAEQHGDFFVRNAIAVLAEQRLALAVKRPESFVRGTFA